MSVQGLKIICYTCKHYMYNSVEYRSSNDRRILIFCRVLGRVEAPVERCRYYEQK